VAHRFFDDQGRLRHKANGGYIVISMIFANLFAYDALKRAIRNREAKIEDVWE
jgi:hypothetical protein